MKIAGNTSGYPDGYILYLAKLAKTGLRVRTRGLKIHARKTVSVYSTGVYDWYEEKILVGIPRRPVSSVYFKPRWGVWEYFTGNFEMDIFTVLAHEIFHHFEWQKRRVWNEEAAEEFAMRQTKKFYSPLRFLRSEKTRGKIEKFLPAAASGSDIFIGSSCLTSK